MNAILKSLWGSASFALWSLRRRVDSIVPVAVSLSLLILAVQITGALHEVSSELTQQQIARSWRGSYDLLIRPTSSVSQPERSANWIDPQSLLQYYGGISPQQVATIRALAHVAQVAPVATLGWQTIDVLLPVELPSMGVYRISATWSGQGRMDSTTERYVDVTDLSHLATEIPLSRPIVQHVLAGDDANPVIYTMSLQAIQAVIGIPLAQQATLRAALLEDIASPSTVPISIHIERLRRDLKNLPACARNVDCWENVGARFIAPTSWGGATRAGTISYQADGVQLLRYSRDHYVATSQQLARGQMSLIPPGTDMQGPIYRTELPENISIPVDNASLSSTLSSSPGILPYSDAERLPLLTSAVHFVPLEKACAVNGSNCYSGLYVRLDGVEQYSQRSLALLQATAVSIAAHTGLHVDILDGSSLRTVSIAISGPYQTGSNTTVLSRWRVVGVAVQIVNGVDGLQEMLLLLCAIVCLLATGAAGALVGIGRRKDALLLQQLGWRPALLIVTFALEGLMLSMPGCLLLVVWTTLATKLWPTTLSPLIPVTFLVIGMLVYSCSLVGAAIHHLEQEHGHGSSRNVIRVPQQASGMGLFICNIAITLVVFLIAEEYLLITSFNQELIVTILGKQVRESLATSQLLLLLVVMGAALLTVGLCTTLLLQGRREELLLLSRVGWERRDVLLRILREGWLPAIVSGEGGVLLAAALAAVLTTPPPLLAITMLVFCGPVTGVLMSSIATAGIACQETGRVYVWR